MCGARSIATESARPALSLLPPVRIAEVIGHLANLVLSPQRPAPDHAEERALPGVPVLALVHPHARAVTLEALRDEDFLARPVGKAAGRGLLLLREGRPCREAADQHSEQ